MTAPVSTSATLRTLLTLAWPLILSRATQAVVGFSDAWMVAPLGEEALAAATTGALDTFTVVILPMGTVFIVQSFVAQLRGGGDLAGVRRYALYGLVIALVAGLLVAAVIPSVPSVIGLLDLAPGVTAQMSDYVSIRFLSVAAVVGIEALGNFYGGLGNTKLPMRVSVLVMVANIAGNWLLIEPRFGLPGYGIAGAATASVVASWIGFFAIGVAFLRGAGWAGLAVPSGPIGFRRDELVRVLRFGLPNGVNWFLEFAAFTLFLNVVVGHLGTTVLAAMNVVFQVSSVAFMPAFGVASSGAILVGEAIGGKRQDDVPRIVRITGITASVWMVSVAACYVTIPEVLVRQFAPRDVPADALIAIGSHMLVVSAAWQLADAIGMTLSEALRAAGDTTWCMGARIFLAWFVFTPAAWIAVFVFGGGATTVVLSLVVYTALLAVTFVWRFMSGRWREIELVEGYG